MTKKPAPSKLQMVRLRPAVHDALHKRAEVLGLRGATLAQRIIEAALGFVYVDQTFVITGPPSPRGIQMAEISDPETWDRADGEGT